MSHTGARFLVAAVAAVSAPRDEDTGFVSYATRHYEVLVDEACEDAAQTPRATPALWSSDGSKSEDLGVTVSHYEQTPLAI